MSREPTTEVDWSEKASPEFKSFTDNLLRYLEAAKEPLEFRQKLENEIHTFQEAVMASNTEDQNKAVTEAPDNGMNWAKNDYDYMYKRTPFVRDLTRELFLERAKSNPSGKIPTDYAKTAHDGAVSVADVLGLVD